MSICCVDGTDGKSRISAGPLHISSPGSLGGELMAGQRGAAPSAGQLCGQVEGSN